jgi:hypothetical protein
MSFVADAAKPATPGQVTLLVNGEPVGGGRLDHTVPFHFNGYSGMDIGRDNGLVVDRDYAKKAPFAFTGTVKKVVFDSAPHAGAQDEHDLHAHAQQEATVRGITGRPTDCRRRRAMSHTEFDVTIAAYLIPELAHHDFDELVQLASDKQLTVEGIALVTNDADGNLSVDETGDHLGRKAMAIGGRVGLAVGLLAPPLLASAVIGGEAGAVMGKFAKHRRSHGWRHRRWG